MNKKIMAITLLTLVMLITPIIGTAQAVGIGALLNEPTIATFKLSMELWPTISPDFELIPPDDKIAMGWKNLCTFGGLPPDYDFVETYPLPGVVSVDDYGKGGIGLTLTIDGNDFELIGTVERKVLLYIQYNNGRTIAIDEWSFEIVDMEDAPALGAVGSSMEGWLVNNNGNVILKSTDGTGYFEGAKLDGKAEPPTAYLVLASAGPPPVFENYVFTVTDAWGKIKLTP